jgi:Leucine-rich repeat (LRR) protein
LRCYGTALKELRLAHNRLKTLPPKLGGNAESLKVLDLSHNRFENWGDLAVLTSLTRLQQLSLRGGASQGGFVISKHSV